MTIGFIGFGNMAQAIARGIDAKRESLGARMIAYNPTRAKIEQFPGEVTACDDPAAVAQASDYLFLCVKPQMLGESIPQFRAHIKSDAVIVSIIAGVTTERLAAMLETDRPIVRVMPNTPLLLGQGTTAIARPAGVRDAQYGFVLDVFRSIGTAYEIPDEKFDEIIPVNGSSPALIYYLAKLVAQNADKHGLDFTTALHMFADTLAGSAVMIRDAGQDIDALINMVCSKGGTTRAMLDRLDERGFPETLDNALDRCVERAKELGQGE